MANIEKMKSTRRGQRRRIDSSKHDSGMATNATGIDSSKRDSGMATNATGIDSSKRDSGMATNNTIQHPTHISEQKKSQNIDVAIRIVLKHAKEWVYSLLPMDNDAKEWVYSFLPMAMPMKRMKSNKNWSKRDQTALFWI
eukprot:518988_1